MYYESSESWIGLVLERISTEWSEQPNTKYDFDEKI